MSTPESELLIDTDVHEALREGRDLLPYIGDEWKHFITDYGWNYNVLPSSYPYAMLIPSFARLDWAEGAEYRPGYDLEAMQKHLFDGEKVTHALLNGSFYPSTRRGHYEFNSALVKAYNDWQIDTWLEKDSRIFGSAHVVAHNPHEAAAEIDRVAEHPQIVQVFLPTVIDREYGDPYYRPIFEAAVRNDLTVAFHHGYDTQTILGWPRYYIQWHTTAAPHAAQGQLVSLICNGVLDEFPTLKTVFLETGVGWLPWFMWRIDQQYKELRHEVPWVKRMPSVAMRAQVRISTQPMGDISSREFAKLVELVDSDEMFMFSSDYPHYDADSAPNVVGRGLPEELRKRVRYENALATYPRLKVALN